MNYTTEHHFFRKFPKDRPWGMGRLNLPVIVCNYTSIAIVYNKKMNARHSILFAVSACFLFTLMVSAEIALFPRNLTLGDSGEDVRALQQTLNASADTRVASAGVGSPGQETDYFGSLTRSAVIRFQEKHATIILTPVGLSYGTGFVGPATRAYLNSTQVKKEVSESMPAPIPSPIQVNKNEPLSVFNNVFLGTEDLFVMFPSLYFGPAGTTLTIHGSGFTQKNTVHFGELYTLPDMPAENPGRLTFTIPARIPTGIYDLWVENEVGGKTRVSDKDAFFVITPAGATAPSIASVAPAVAKWGNTVTVRGAGFTPTGNIARTSFGIFSGLSSPDGATISFTIEPAVFKDAVLSAGGKSVGVQFPMDIYIVNANGVSASGKFIFEL